MKLPNNQTSHLPNSPIAELPNNPITQLPNNLLVVFFGSSKFVIPILEVLRKNFTLSLVLTTEKSSTDAVPSYCIKNKTPHFSVQQFNNLTIEQLKKLNTSMAVLADFGLIIPQQVLDLFPKGIINIHPSLLPKYRGPTPVQTAILNGEKTTGVTIIKLDEEIDHGPILGFEKEKILNTDTSESLYKRLFEKGANLLLKVLPNYIKGDLKSNAQNHKQATFTSHLTRKDGLIDLNNPPAPEKLQRMIRAYFPWPGVWTRLRLGYVGEAKIIKFLPEKKVQVEGKKPMSYKDFKNGYPNLKQIHALLDGL